jgi:hypothetical protein
MVAITAWNQAEDRPGTGKRPKTISILGPGSSPASAPSSPFSRIFPQPEKAEECTAPVLYTECPSDSPLICHTCRIWPQLDARIRKVPSHVYECFHHSGFLPSCVADSIRGTHSDLISSPSCFAMVEGITLVSRRAEYWQGTLAVFKPARMDQSRKSLV